MLYVLHGVSIAGIAVIVWGFWKIAKAGGPMDRHY